MATEPPSALTYLKRGKTIDGYFKTYSRLESSLPFDATRSYRYTASGSNLKSSSPDLQCCSHQDASGQTSDKARQSHEERRIQPSSRRNSPSQENNVTETLNLGFDLLQDDDSLCKIKARRESSCLGRSSRDQLRQPNSVSPPRTQTGRYSLSESTSPSPSCPLAREVDMTSFRNFALSVPHVPPYYRSSSALPGASRADSQVTSAPLNDIDAHDTAVTIDSISGCILNDRSMGSSLSHDSPRDCETHPLSSPSSVVRTESPKGKPKEPSSWHGSSSTVRDTPLSSVNTRSPSLSKRSLYHLPTSGRSNFRSDLSHEEQETASSKSTLPDLEDTPPIERSSSSNEFAPHSQDSSFASATKLSTQDHTHLLRLPRFNRVLTLQRPPYKAHQVSFSDIGATTGHPVFVFLGLGGIRYLTVLFEELASVMNLRLICVDRWGLGKTDGVSSERRGFVEWAKVIEEVADELGIDKFGILAHSAGSPYAMAVAAKYPERLMGSINLLAPWVGLDIDGGYKWLKYVPTTIIKATQTAEWKMQGWMLGKASNPVSAPSSPRSVTERPVAASPKTMEGSVRHSQENHASIESTSPSQSRPVASLSRSPSPFVEEQPSPSGDTSLSIALLRACHAENGGRTEDLLAIMRKPAMWGFSYTDVQSQVNVWYGDRDDRVSEKSILWMERSLPNCRLFLRPGESHDLLSSTHIVLEVLECLAEDARDP